MKNPSLLTPVIITMGDPHGVGPEVVLKALNTKEVAARVIPVVVGSLAVLRRADRLIRGRAALVSLTRDSLRGAKRKGVVYVVSPDGPLVTRARGADIRLRGRTSFTCVREAVKLCTEGHASALVTAPISKASLAAAGVPYRGHTEMLRELCGVRRTVMMFAWGRRRISLVTTHVPISAVKKTLTRRRVEDTILLTHRGLRLLFRVARPRLAVLSLNPHKGESGILGREEQRVIEPAIENSSTRGVKVCGPFAADSFFSRNEWKEFDAVVAMYHDQGLIPAKLVGGDRAINVTLGLPFVRTSPGHGTAEDIAWKGMANPDAMVSAILLAAKLARNARSPLMWDSI